MAPPQFETELHMAEHFVESAGIVLFRLSTREVCILHLLRRHEYILPKGRRNLGESPRATATRDTTEETGMPCRLFPVDLLSRLCPAVETGHVPDEPRLFKDACEPIALQTRQAGKGGIKLVWWYVAAVNEEEPAGQHEKDRYGVELHSYDTVLERLTFRDDRELAKKAIELVTSSVGEWFGGKAYGK